MAKKKGLTKRKPTQVDKVTHQAVYRAGTMPSVVIRPTDPRWTSIQLPAMCRECGTAFGSGIHLPRGNTADYLGGAWPCPKCGSPSPLPDIIAIRDPLSGAPQTVRLPVDLKALPSGMTYRELQHLADIARAVLAGTAGPEQLREALETASPSVRGVQALASPTTQGWIALASLVVAIVSAVAGMLGPGDNERAIPDRDLQLIIFDLIQENKNLEEALRHEVEDAEQQHENGRNARNPGP